MPSPATPLRLAISLLLAGVSAQAGAGFIVSGADTAAKTLASGAGAVTATGNLSVSGSTTAVTVTGTSTIDNSGTIAQTGSGRTIRVTANNMTLDVTNKAAAHLTSNDADTYRVDSANVAASLDNSGEVLSTNTSNTGNQAVDWNAIRTAANSVTNPATGRIEASGADAVRPGTNGVISNAGTIIAKPVTEGTSPNRAASSSDGIDTQDRSGVQVTNTGSISGRHGITGGGNATPIAITVTNEVTGSIQGVNGSSINIDGSGSFATIVNRGAIAGQYDATRYDSGDGDGVDVDGTVHLTNYGTITGTNSTAPSNPEGVSIGGGTLINHAGGTIRGNNTLGAAGVQGNGLLVDDSNGGNAFAATQVTNAGTIRGFQGFAVKLIGNYADTIDNQAGGTLRGAGAQAAVQTGGGSDQVTNAGAIVGDGGLALDLGDGDDTLTIAGGAASILGSVSGGAGTNHLALDLGASNAFTYQGVMTGFGSASLGSGSAALAGSIDGVLSVAAGATLAPGNSVGNLDLGGLGLAATGVLAIEIDPTNAQGNGTADQVRVSGAVDLGLGDLVLSLYSAPTLGQIFDIVLNDGVDPIIGRFAQGDRITATFGGETYAFAIDYGANADGGGQGNDVRLVAVPLPGTVWLLGLGVLGLDAEPNAYPRRLITQAPLSGHDVMEQSLNFAMLCYPA